MFFFCLYYSLFCCAADQPSTPTWRALSSDSAHIQFTILVRMLFLYIVIIFVNKNNLNWNESLSTQSTN